MNRLGSTHGIATRWRQWRATCAASRTSAGDDFVGPLARPVWPVWVDAAHEPRHRREPQRSDPPRRPRSAGCGWFESSDELRGGLEVREELWIDLPGPGELGEAVRFL